MRCFRKKKCHSEEALAKKEAKRVQKEEKKGNEKKLIIKKD